MSNATATAECAAVPTTEAQVSTTSKWHALAAASLGILFDAMDASIYFMVLYPALSEVLRTKSDTEIGWYGSLILAVFMVGWALGSIIFGLLADYIGRAKTMIITVVLYAVCTGLCALSQSWQELAFYRFLVGLGIGGEISIGAVLLSEVWGASKNGIGRVYAICIMECAFCLGYLCTSLANLSVGNISWRALFVIGVIPAVLAFYIRWKLKESNQFHNAKSARQHMRRKNDHKLAIVAIFDRDMLDKTAIITTLTGVAIVGYWAALSWIPAWINQLTGTLAVQERSAAGIVLNVGGLLSCLAAAWLINKFGRRATLKFAFAGSLLSTALMFVLVKSYSVALLVWLAFVGFFTCIPFTVVCVVIPELFPTRMLGTGSGFAFSIGRLVAAAAAILGGQIISLFHGSYAAAGASIALVYGIGFIVTYFLPKTSGALAGVSEHHEDPGPRERRKAKRPDCLQTQLETVRRRVIMQQH